MQSKIEIQRQKINAVRKLLRSTGPLCGTVAVIADQIIDLPHELPLPQLGTSRVVKRLTLEPRAVRALGAAHVPSPARSLWPSGPALHAD